ncbi:MAG: hypothetical protein JNK31_07340 [Candidatus Competibacter sp.]|nr:hypothetical protein [Candidatus Competibacter sp.]
MNPERALFGFVAGFLATLIFHQFTLAALWAAGLAPFAPFSLAPTSPLGVPAVLSLAFWGGIWGIVLAAIEARFPPRGGYWLAAFAFGALAPSLVAWFVVLPLKGRPAGGGWPPPLLVTALLINGAWGLGSALIFKFLRERFGSNRRVGL